MLPLQKQILINFSNLTSGPADYPVGRYSEAAYCIGQEWIEQQCDIWMGKAWPYMSSIVQVLIGPYSHD